MYMEGGSTVLDTVPTIMEEVLYNVCDNAVKYNRRGGEVFVRLKDGEDAVRVNVRDTGIGIPKEDQERIFGTLLYGWTKAIPRKSAEPVLAFPL